MKLPRYSLASLVLATLCFAVYFACVSQNARQRARTIATYKAQRRVVDDIIDSYVSSLESRGWSVTDNSTGISGSGEWRRYVALTCINGKSETFQCYVEVMGFVSHDSNGRPDWYYILPMRLSSRLNLLDQEFIEHAMNILASKDWDVIVESGVRDVRAIGVPSHYAAYNGG